MRSLRARQKSGRAVFHFEYDEIALKDALVGDRFLPPNQVEDSAAVKAALERMVLMYVLDAKARGP